MERAGVSVNLLLDTPIGLVVLRNTCSTTVLFFPLQIIMPMDGFSPIKSIWILLKA